MRLPFAPFSGTSTSRVPRNSSTERGNLITLSARMTSDFPRPPIDRNRTSWVQTIHERLQEFLFPAVPDQWLVILRLGLGIQVTLYSLSLRADWNNLFGGDASGFI